MIPRAGLSSYNIETKKRHRFSISANVVRALDYQDLEGVAQRAQFFVEQAFSYEAAVESYRRLLEPILLNNKSILIHDTSVASNI